MLLTPHDENRWAFHRDTSVVEDIERVTWVADDGITYLRPEVALASKARLARPKDTADFDIVVPLLDGSTNSAEPAREVSVLAGGLGGPRVDQREVLSREPPHA